ncbi:MAG: polyprenyl synthetase family protein [Synergistaceae bacterium]|nr:polyprenyl synthetase family protein [Synergistaceae bacterium]
MKSSADFRLEYDRAKNFFEEGLEKFCALPPGDVPPRLAEAMNYSLKAGGKRLRPALCIKSAEIFGLEGEKIMPMALALEMIHTASLIHDDLPAMDDDDLRRGKPTNHKLFGEGPAILAGDALMALAFEHPLEALPALGIPFDRVCGALLTLARALGPSGICGGQMLDIDTESMEDSPDFPMKVAKQKTAVLIKASVLTGAIIAGADGGSLSALETYGEHLGIAFQVVDDILDVTAPAETLGKTPGKDREQNKRTFASVWGLEGAKQLAGRESGMAAHALEGVKGDTTFLRLLTDYLQDRTM